MSYTVMVCHHYRVDRVMRQDESLPIYYGTNIQNDEPIILKAEDVDCRFSFNGYSGSRMFYEGKVLQALQGGRGIPNMNWCGQDNDFNFLIMERLGDNLESLLQKCEGRFGLKTVLMIAHQTLSVLQYIHFKGLLHRGIRPSNFTVGNGKKNSKIYLIDFATTLRYRLAKNNQHFKEGYKGFNRHNTHFSSCNVNKGYDGSRRDDLQSWLYMIVYFLKGTLPWKKISVMNEYTRENRILEMKEATTNEELCEGLPAGFQQLGKYISSLKFTERPSYSFMKNLLRDMLKAMGEEFDNVYDWMLVIPPHHSPANLVECLTMHLPMIPNEEAFLKQQRELYERQLTEKENIDNILRTHIQSSVTDATNLPLRDELKPPKQCTIF